MIYNQLLQEHFYLYGPVLIILGLVVLKSLTSNRWIKARLLWPIVLLSVSVVLSVVLLFQPGSPRTFYIASDGGIYRSQNLGISYERLDDGLQTSQFYNGFSNSHQSADIAIPI